MPCGPKALEKMQSGVQQSVWEMMRQVPLKYRRAAFRYSLCCPALLCEALLKEQRFQRREDKTARSGHLREDILKHRESAALTANYG